MAKKKLAIIKVATILFAQKGYAETTVAELARLTQVAEGTIFYHFKTKSELFIAILEDVKAGITNEFDKYMESVQYCSGLEMMEKVVAFFLYLAGRHEEWFLLLQRHYPYELARENNACRSHLTTIYNTLLNLFEGAILRGQEDGSIAIQLSSHKTALILFSMINGLIWLNFNNLYDAATLYEELLGSCRKVLITPKE
jgi:AcrR family transcriptional regulator